MIYKISSKILHGTKDATAYKVRSSHTIQEDKSYNVPHNNNNNCTTVSAYTGNT